MALYYQQYYNASQLNNNTQNNHNNNQLPVYEGAYLDPYSKLSADGCSNLILSQYAPPSASPITLSEVTQVTKDINNMVDQIYDSVKVYDRAYWITFMIAMILAIPTLGLSVIAIIFVVFLPMMKAQKIVTNINTIAKPQIQQYLERKNQERFEPAGLQWCIGYRQVLFETSFDLSLRPVVRQVVMVVTQQQPQQQPVYTVPQPTTDSPFNPNQQPMYTEQK